MPVFTPETLLKLEELFSSHGPLAQQYHLQRRKGQLEMVLTIAQALVEDKGCIIEASTGTGKTLAYLFPAAEFIIEGTAKGLTPRVIISTASKGLQDQLVKKDFPLLTHLYPNLKCEVWKGANNYLCMNRLHKVVLTGKKSTRAEALELWRLKDDLEKLKTGARDEIGTEVSDELWQDICGGTPCCQPQESDLICYKRKSFQRAKESNILCMNHTFLAFMALYTPFLHPAEPKEEEFLLIIDEGHELQAQLRNAINREFSFAALRQRVHTLQNSEIKSRLLLELEDIVDTIAQNLPEWGGLQINPDHTELIQHLKILVGLMFRCSYELEKDHAWITKSGFFIDEQEAWEAKSQYEAISNSANQLLQFLDSFPKDTMLELSQDYERKTKFSRVRVSFRPFTYEKELQHIYSFSKLPPIITSATLINGTHKQLLDTFSLQKDNVVIKQISSDFDYLTTIKGFVFPEFKSPGDPEALSKWLKHIIPISYGNALILFTNRWVMEQCALLLGPWLLEEGYPLLIQNDAQTPTELSGRMKTQHNCVLFGLKSLWTGIDIKGKNLSSVIVTRLPFDAPDSYSNAYGEYLKEKGDHPFWEWALPEMINRFRQGIGRLKRDNTDKGLIFILDSRFVTARYKPNLIGRLPLMEWQQIRTPSDLPGIEMSQWLDVTPPKKP